MVRHVKTAMLWIILGAALTGCSIKFGLWSGTVNWHQLRFFTTLSNLLAAAYCLYALCLGRDRTPALLHGAALMAALVTGAVYHLLLRGTFGGFQLLSRDWLGDQLLHTAVPVLMALDWLLCAPKGRFKAFHPLGWACVPLAYLALTVAIARTGLCLPNSNTPTPIPFWTCGLWAGGRWGATRRRWPWPSCFWGGPSRLWIGLWERKTQVWERIENGMPA